MKLRTKALIAALLLSCGAGAVSAQEVRTIKLNNDLDQKYMTSKVYELKNIRCDDITPWVLGAVYRYNIGSTVQRLNYKVGNKQFIVVTTGVDMMPYVDEMVAKMDRPVANKDASGSIVDGTGIYDFVYRPKFRGNTTMLTAITDTRSDGMQYYNDAANMFYWKDSKSDGECALKWLTALDRPYPQATIQLNVYEISDNDFTELGVDWIAWKNGPGASLFGAGMDFTKYKSFSDVSLDGIGNNLIADGAMGSLGGFMVAPQFDATFLRMLTQKGKGKVASSGQITLTNNYGENPTSYTTANYRLQFVPKYLTIQKDSSMNLSINSATPSFQFYLRTPTLGFGAAGDKMGTATFGWNLEIQDSVENANINGANEVVNVSKFYSDTTMAAGSEKLLATYIREHKVNQNDGMPFLTDIPGIKYLAGATADTVTRSRIFVTVTVVPVTPDTKLSEWAGQVVDLSKLPEANKE